MANGVISSDIELSFKISKLLETLNFNLTKFKNFWVWKNHYSGINLFYSQSWSPFNVFYLNYQKFELISHDCNVKNMIIVIFWILKITKSFSKLKKNQILFLFSLVSSNCLLKFYIENNFETLLHYRTKFHSFLRPRRSLGIHLRCNIGYNIDSSFYFSFLYFSQPGSPT